MGLPMRLDCLKWSANLILCKKDEEYFTSDPNYITSKFTIAPSYNPDPETAEFDNYLFDLAEENWSLCSFRRCDITRAKHFFKGTLKQI